MKIEVNIKGPERTPVGIMALSYGSAFRLVDEPNAEIYILDTGCDSHYYCVNTATLRTTMIDPPTRVYPVTIKKARLELEIE